MEINSGHERPFARLGQAELAREDGRQGFRMRIFADIAVAAAFVTCSVALHLNRRLWSFTVT
jgi:hypothetical protein